MPWWAGPGLAVLAAVMSCLLMLAPAESTAAPATASSQGAGREAPPPPASPALRLGSRTGLAANRPLHVGRYVAIDREEFSWAKGYQVWSDRPRQGWFGCLVPKVGCSSWLHYIRTQNLPKKLADYLNAEDPYRCDHYPASRLYFRRYHPRSAFLADMRSVEQHVNSPEVFTFAIVRHPWDRLVSGYRSKYEGQCKGQAACLRELFRVPVPKGQQRLTFHEFVAVLARADVRAMDAHFRPMLYVCDLDRVRYDFIGELMSHEDTSYISARLGANRTFADVEAERFESVRGARYYGGHTHRVQNCTAATVALAQRLYAADASLLGYSFQAALDSCAQHGLSRDPGLLDAP